MVDDVIAIKSSSMVVSWEYSVFGNIVLCLCVLDLFSLTATRVRTVASRKTPTLQTASELRSRMFEASLESSMKNGAVMCVRMFSAIRRLPADDPFKQPPRSLSQWQQSVWLLFMRSDTVLSVQHGKHLWFTLSKRRGCAHVRQLVGPGPEHDLHESWHGRQLLVLGS